MSPFRYALALGLLTLPCYSQTIPEMWDRQAEWTDEPGSSHGTTMGNPAPDSAGNLVWHYDYAIGGPLGSMNPWYDEPSTPLTWDDSWFSGAGVWSYGDNIGCLVRPTSSTHMLQAPLASSYDRLPVTRWKNVTSADFDVDVVGTLRIGWAGDGGSASTTDVDIVVLHRDGATGTSSLLLSRTVPKPTPTTQGEAVLLGVDVSAVHVARGDEIVWTFRCADPSTASQWVSVSDRLRLVRTTVGRSYCGPSATNSTTLESTLIGRGSPVVSDNDLTLMALQVPHQSFGYFLTSRTQGFVANPAGSQGNLCLGGAIGRFVGPGQVQNSGLSHIVELDIDLTQMPSPHQGLIAAQAGEIWNFQYWFRDTGSTSNFSTGLELRLL